ncbi:hypothetical protein KP509_32G038800 [Ceratopteris richardii]|uniref:Transmembrane protein n=4 Tax=Ceratopteris richardii TaxID=49495 RepID=A0A8T2QU52_CERRI|nr:hypothetical protein KP509_32G038800 [Ceratopteris richardii]
MLKNIGMPMSACPYVQTWPGYGLARRVCLRSRVDRTCKFLTLAQAGPEKQQDAADRTEKTAGKNMRERKSLWGRLMGRREYEKSDNVALESSRKMDINWGDILNPTPENLLALLLTGLLGLAIVQIFWQLLLVAVTITLAALKYSVIAAILLALLIVFL